MGNDKGKAKFISKISAAELTAIVEYISAFNGRLMYIVYMDSKEKNLGTPSYQLNIDCNINGIWKVLMEMDTQMLGAGGEVRLVADFSSNGVINSILVARCNKRSKVGIAEEILDKAVEYKESKVIYRHK